MKSGRQAVKRDAVTAMADDPSKKSSGEEARMGASWELPELPVFPATIPEWDPGGWRLNLDGLVDRHLSFTFEELSRLPTTDLVDDFRCEEGWVAPNLRWEGVAVTEVLAAAGLLGEAGYVSFSAGEFSASLTLKEVQASNALLALRLNGEPLPAAHGGPCRLVAVGKECYFSVKWLERIAVTSGPPSDTAREIALRRIESKTGP